MKGKTDSCDAKIPIRTNSLNAYFIIPGSHQSKEC